MKNYLNQFLIKKALRHLKSSDAVLSPLIEKYGPCTIVPSLNNPFHALVNSIIGQQLSAHSARAIRGRLSELFGTRHFTPKAFLKSSVQNLRSAGLSRAKAQYILGIAAAVKKGEIDFSYIIKCNDEDVISSLIALSGVGRWTAEMFLIFGLGRPDILSVDDAGLKRGFKIIYNLPEIPSSEQMISISEPWKPYRSVASWYLWRSID